jgi:hypothetical protein
MVVLFIPLMAAIFFSLGAAFAVEIRQFDISTLQRLGKRPIGSSSLPYNVVPMGLAVAG